jgi:hypothetical protein
MPGSLQEELKQFEKELSLLLVRFMKICDQVEATKAAIGGPQAPTSPAVSMPTPRKTEGSSFVAYV